MAVAKAVLASVLLLAAPLEAVTPVQKVLTLLSGMVEKGKKEKHEEQVTFAAYKQFCDDTTVEKTRSIAEANEEIDKLNADIEKYEEHAAKLANEIAKHADDIATWQGDLKASTKVRQIEHEDYLSTHQDYGESIAALQAGIKTINGQNKVTAQADLLQFSTAKLIPDETKHAMDAFLSQGFSDLDENLAVSSQQPAAAAYEFQSNALVEMLTKLIEKFKDELAEVEKEELAAVQAFKLLEQDLTTYIETATKAHIEKSEEKAKDLELAGDAKVDLGDTTAARDNDAKYLSDLTATCEAKAAQFEARQKLRADEIEAVEKAIEILSSGDVAGNAEKHLPALLQTRAASLAQLRSVARDPAQLQVAAFLDGRAAKLKSRILRALATRVAEDPFKKVTKMIKDLIVKLMEEANGEAEHKGWCDSELATNEQTRKSKTETVETLHAEIDELEASVAKLEEEIAVLNEEVADIDAAVAKETGIREAEKAKNAITVKDAQEAQTAVAAALATLKDFYAKAGQATALVQSKAREDPTIFKTEYKGMGAENGGVVGMIEVIQSDFARLESETTDAEVEASKEYGAFMDDSRASKTAKTTDIENKESKKQNDSQELDEKKTDLMGTQKELDAALQYYEKLKPSCVDSGVSYDDRVSMRKEEIASLKEALSILEGEAVA